MPNQLSIPSKKTSLIQIRQAVREYILSKHTDTHPDAFRWDIGRWEALRKDAVGGVLHVDRVKPSLIYHAQLVFILTKLPPDIGLEISYAPAFDPNALPVTLCNLVYERASVLFNLAALSSQLGAAEDRSTPRCIPDAHLKNQNAAGTLDYMASSVLPQLSASVTAEDMPPELTEPSIRCLQSLMLAQAQECVWQRAVMDNYKNGLIAKLAMKVSSLYSVAVVHVRDASSSIRRAFPSPWIPHMETKQLHFQAAAQYRKSVDDLEAHRSFITLRAKLPVSLTVGFFRYGHEIARLAEAEALAKKGYDVARRGGVAPPVLHDIKSVLDSVQKSLARAERDNDLIYHQEVPPASALPPIQEVSMVQPLVNPCLTDPKSAIGSDSVIFGELLSWGAKTAIEIYVDRRQNWIKDELIDRAQALDDTAHRTLESLHLPAALEALEKPIGLPPSLLKKAEDVRLETGPSKIETLIQDVRTLAKHSVEILDEAMDILDQEAEEDEVFRAEHPADRLPSQDANEELTGKEQRYRSILDQAGSSDELVRQKWDEWEKNIVQLTWSEAELEACVPSSTVSFPRRSATGTTPTQIHARALRVMLETLDDITQARGECVTRANHLAASEDITPRILKAAAAVERWVEVQPSMFEDVLDEELAKYDKFRVGIDEGEQKQSELLESIKERNTLFLESRKEDASVKEREHALQSLDLAYHKYKEIVKNLYEGLKFYNDFSEILTHFRDGCKDWVNVRRHEIHSLERAMESVSLEPDIDGTAAEHSTANDRKQITQPQPAYDLPPPDSGEWETFSLPPGPSSMSVKHSMSNRGKKMRQH
ncbi:pH-response regulator protein palA/RIM20 [Grifola frondosa]|uniref:pH-response regulator protein palA/RIM20 n=1 Tax=Grifola frondosa TaxID=5627 RepID=A0A1C7M668_GRIFR|nr:pH-response regulator protein palA/RIM20 [Grifola frondosa]